MLKIHTKLISFLTLLVGLNLRTSIKFNGQNSVLQISGTGSLILSTPLDVSGTIKILNKSSTSLQSTTTNDFLTFLDGVYQNSTSGKSMLTGRIDTTTVDKIILDTGKSLICDSQTIIESVEIRNGGNVILGQPTFSTGIILQNSLAAVSLGIQNKFSQSVQMNGGTITLVDDLTLEEGVFFIGNGTVDIGNKTLTLPPAIDSSWTGNLNFVNANDINLTGFTRLDGTWTFSSETSRINGNGCVLDFSASGEIAIAPGQTLYLNDVCLRRLGASGGNLTFGSETSHLRISGVTFELAGSFTLASGLITVENNDCKIIFRNAEQFIIDTVDATLTVDGVVLYFDPLGTTPSNEVPIVSTSTGTITFFNDGVIRPSIIVESINFSIDSGTGNNLLLKSFVLGSSSTIGFINENLANPKSMVLDGQGYFLQFNYLTSQYLTINENITLTFTNILLKDFDFALIDFQGAGATKAKILFGDNVTISLNKDLTLSATAIVATGDTTIFGNGTRLNVSATDMVTINNASKVLTIKDLNINLTNATGIKCLNDTSKLILQNSTLHMTNVGMTFATGMLDIKDRVRIEGMDQTTSGGTSTMTFSSKGNLRVLTGSTLSFARNLIFSYNPDISADANAAASKRHLLLIDPSSTLFLDSCNLVTASMGFALDYGQVFVDGKTLLQIDPSVGAEVEFGSALQVEISPSGILDIDGALKYTSTTYP